MAKTEFYVTVEPTFNSYGNLSSVRATSLTKNRPKRFTRSGSITVKLALEIPDSAFLPLKPEAIVVIPEDLTRANLPVVVEATDPGDDDDEPDDD